MGKDALQSESRQVHNLICELQYVFGLLSAYTQSSHPRIHFHMYLDRFSKGKGCTRERLRRLNRVQGDSQPQAYALAHLPERNIAKDKNGSADTRFTQRNRLAYRCHS